MKPRGGGEFYAVARRASRSSGLQAPEDRAAGDQREAGRVERVQPLVEEQHREDGREHRDEVREEPGLHRRRRARMPYANSSIATSVGSTPR